MTEWLTPGESADRSRVLAQYTFTVRFADMGRLYECRWRIVGGDVVEFETGPGPGYDGPGPPLDDPEICRASPSTVEHADELADALSERPADVRIARAPDGTVSSIEIGPTDCSADGCSRYDFTVN